MSFLTLPFHMTRDVDARPDSIFVRKGRKGRKESKCEIKQNGKLVA